MSNQNDKIKNSLRRHRDHVAVKKQLEIVKDALHAVSDNSAYVKQPHRMHKHHAMNCGQSGCVMCGNPRKIFNELTIQEKRLFQDLDNPRKSNDQETDQTDKS